MVRFGRGWLGVTAEAGTPDSPMRSLHSIINFGGGGAGDHAGLPCLGLQPKRQTRGPRRAGEAPRSCFN